MTITLQGFTPWKVMRNKTQFGRRKIIFQLIILRDNSMLVQNAFQRRHNMCAQLLEKVR
jgi:hypothetical protein